ncbi:GIY-YIG nuclease family protein [Blastochloris tepida]|uniref:GIY-YIG domain-containing protein n=1 Tax=Blastochloris tepida TaxID=2233851 RepID=A0A348G1H9_9HYPH|nr:GIY-YIG nuclease family protein [Blastochloris tepida]BBF93412.1 hypothetical protein BLTE_20970 [Blastochloris tepida]
MTTAGRSIRLFLVDGTPTGIITAEIMNWTGHVIVAPRSRLADFVQRPEAGRTGVYFLVGENPESALKPLVYIGETDNVGKRLIQHNKDDSKAFFDRFCVVTSKDFNLTKAHARYLESRLISRAQGAGQSKLTNGTAPDFGRLPEADLADMDFFVAQIETVLPVLGMSFLKEAPTFSLSVRDSAAPGVGATAASGSDGDLVSDLSKANQPTMAAPTIFKAYDKRGNWSARAVEIDGQIVVLKGSHAAKTVRSSLSTKSRLRRDDLTSSGILVEDPEHSELYVFTEDVAFSSPSQASDVIFAYSSNGRTAWLVEGTRQTYAEWQEAQIAAHAPQGGDE